MIIIDIILLTILLIGAFKGYRRGFLLEIIAIGALLLGIIGGLRLLHWGMEILSDYFEIHSQLLPYITFIVIFIGIILLVNLLGKAMKKIIDMTLLGNFDDIAGAVIGIIKWAFGLSVILWISNRFGITIPEHLTDSSRIYPWIEDFAPSIVGYLTGIFPFIEDLLKLISDFINLN